MWTKEQVFWEDLRERLEKAEGENLYRSLKASPAPGQINFADNDYLGMAKEPLLIEAAHKAAQKYGAGSGAARLISATSPLHVKLENEIARFKRKERALVYGSGYAANLGIVSALVGDKDLVILDKLSHASLIDAARLSGATLRVYPHKNLKKLESILKKSDSSQKKLIATDSVFSMDGDLAPLPELIALKEKHDALLMVDEAHGTGVFGENGRGAAEHFGAEDSIDVAMGTLSKAVGSFGGFVAGPTLLIDYLVNFSRPFIFATALPPAVIGAALEGLRLIEAEPERREKLWNHVRRVREALLDMGYSIGLSESPIFPILVGEEEMALKLSQFLSKEGLFIPAIRYPTVGRGQARLRLTVSARHSPQEIDRLLASLRRARELLK